MSSSYDRSIGVALDYSATSTYALKWAVDNVVRERDQLVVLVVHKDIDENDGQYQLFGKYGSRERLTNLTYLLTCPFIGFFRCHPHDATLCLPYDLRLSTFWPNQISCRSLCLEFLLRISGRISSLQSQDLVFLSIIVL